MKVFWIAAGVVSIAAHVSAAVWINDHEPAKKIVRCTGSANSERASSA